MSDKSLIDDLREKAEWRRKGGNPFQQTAAGLFEKAADEIERLQEERSIYKNWYADGSSYIFRLEQMVKTAHKSLEFYADSSTYQHHPPATFSLIWNDKGEIARKALKGGDAA